jgi:MscS family membrane protein
MPSRLAQISPWRKRVTPRRLLRNRSRATGVTAWTALLVVASVFVGGPASMAIAQDLAIGMAAGTGPGMVQPAPEAARIAAWLQESPEAADETAQPAETEAPQPPDETAEPAPSETPEPPIETIEPTSELPEATAETPGVEPTVEETPMPEETTGPGLTEPADGVETATAAPTLTPTPRVLVWPTNWPGGTIDTGEGAPPIASPIRVTIAEWLQLALGGVVVALGATFGGRVLYRLSGSVIASRQLDVDETFLVEIQPLFSWWLAAIGIHIAVWWVNFGDARARGVFADLVFFVYLSAATLTAWRLVDRAIDLYTRRIAAQGQAATVEKLHPVLLRWARIFILLLSLLVGLGRLQGGFSVPTLLVMLIGLAVSLAARDTLTDVIAGFFILVDQPFRIGDRIEVQGVDTWAEVVNVGLRTSVLLTRHNVEIVVPNSTIGKNQVINYSYPDPRYRMQTDVGIAFGTNVEYARQVLIDAVRQSDCVLPDEPVQVLYWEIGDSAMIFRVRWWVNFHEDWERSYDRIHTAVHNALAEAGIESPYPSQSLNVEIDDETLAEARQVWQEQRAAASPGDGNQSPESLRKWAPSAQDG